jgi:golgi phosphoprotein 3
MLSFAEEIYLLALDDVKGTVSLPGGIEMMHRALVGSALAELSFMGRLDSDKDGLFIVNAEPVDNPALEEIMGLIADQENKMSIHYWLEVLFSEAGKIEANVLEHLILRGILKQVDEKVLWVFPSRRYPVIDDREIKDVERRMVNLISSDEIPDPREATLISLASSCGLLEEILSPRQFSRYEERIAILTKLDSVGRNTVEVINEFSVAFGFAGPATVMDF